MFKRISILLRQDFTNTLRDNILIYSLVGPLLLALGARLFLPSVDQAALTIAVDASVDQGIIHRLEQIGRVQTYPDARTVESRVLRNDDVPGVILVDSQPVLVLEGNEAEGVEVMTLLVSQVLLGDPAAEYTLTRNEGARSLLTEYTAIIFILIGLLLGALLMGFHIIEDKETRAIRALGVSPLSMLELTLARGLFAVGVGLFLTISLTAILLGSQVNYPLLLAASFFSLALPVLVGYVIGGLADSQLKAIAILKFFMLIYLTLPIVTIFIPRDWHFFFYILPNYWMWQTLESALIGQTGGFGLWISGMITLSSSLVLVFLLLPMLRRQLKLR
jgi:ABC-2 type transport system permease protein